jgi:hypothetical protein
MLQILEMKASGLSLSFHIVIKTFSSSFLCFHCIGGKRFCEPGKSFFNIKKYLDDNNSN